MERLNPYLNYIATTSHLPNKTFVRAYDCRFLFVLSGEGELITRNEQFLLSKNTLAYYPAGSDYFLKSSIKDPLSFVTVNFDFTRSYPKRTAPFGPVKPCDYLPKNERPTQTEISLKWFSSVFTIENAFFLRDDFILLSSLFEKEEAYTDEMCATLLKYIILKISNHFCTERQENKIVRQVIDFIEDNYANELDNSIIAVRLGYHPYYLSTLLKIHTGKTLHKYISDARLKYGVNLLLHTAMPISEIALKCGFQNANHFSAKFKKQYGEPPSKWKKLNNLI